MTFMEWREELDSYLISLPKEERSRILSYYSEIYADKRDDGFSEREIIIQFGAPYDVAKKVKDENFITDSGESIEHRDGGRSETVLNKGHKKKNNAINTFWHFIWTIFIMMVYAWLIMLLVSIILAFAVEGIKDILSGIIIVLVAPFSAIGRIGGGLILLALALIIVLYIKKWLLRLWNKLVLNFNKMRNLFGEVKA